MSVSASPKLMALPYRHRVMARVGHLVPRKQIEIERAVRLLRAHFINRRPRSPKHGTLHQVMLVDAGYHDYHHMMRDFLAFTGMRPAQFIAIESKAPERLFGQFEK